MRQYFTDNSDLPHHYYEIKFNYMGNALSFLGDDGVFSKTEADPASVLLLNHLPPLSGNTLDLGCGYGLIGISLKKAYPNVSVLCSDINPRAVELTKKNAEKNSTSVDVVCCDGVFRERSPYQFIILNPPIRAGKETVFRLYTQSTQALSENGSLFVVIQKKHGAQSSYKKLCTLFHTVDTRYKKGGYYIFECKKYKGESYAEN